MKHYSKLNRILSKFKWPLAILGFAVIILSGKMSYYIFYWGSNIFAHVLILIIGLLLMLPLVLYILKERKI